MGEREAVVVCGGVFLFLERGEKGGEEFFFLDLFFFFFFFFFFVFHPLFSEILNGGK